MVTGPGLLLHLSTGRAYLTSALSFFDNAPTLFCYASEEDAWGRPRGTGSTGRCGRFTALSDTAKKPESNWKDAREEHWGRISSRAET